MLLVLWSMQRHPQDAQGVQHIQKHYGVYRSGTMRYPSHLGRCSLVARTLSTIRISSIYIVSEAHPGD